MTEDTAAGIAGITELDPAEVRERMSGNLCRCAAYVGIVDAVLEAAGTGPVTASAVATQATGTGTEGRTR